MQDKLTKWIGCVAVLYVGGCSAVYTGPRELSACLSNENIMEQYRADPATSKMLVGGINPQTREIECYWGEGKPYFNTNFANPWNLCNNSRREGCAILASNNDIVFKEGYRRPPLFSSSSSAEVERPTESSFFSVVWHLLGSFAAGYAQGYLGQYTAPPQAYGTPPSKPRFNCTPTYIGSYGAPVYQCR
jgi:hypothetical protein